MKQLLVIILSVGLASADIGLTYKVPDTSYGVPSYQYNNNADYNNAYAGASGYTYKVGSTAQTGFQNLDQQAGYQQIAGQQAGYQNASPLGADSSAGYQTANYQNNLGSQYSQTGGLNTGSSWGANSGYNTVSQPSYQYSDASASSQGGYQYQSSSEYQSSAVQKYQQFYKNWQQAPAQVFKHFYVHAAPEEPEQPRIPPAINLPPPQKHYKIIFIKAPTQTVYQPQYIPVPQPNEEKTIVYVLVKKPEEQQQVVVPKIEQKAPSKPEVFFIKYNGNKADSSAVINNIVSDYNKVDNVNFAAPGSENQFGSSSGQYNQAGQSNQGYYNNQFSQKVSGGQGAAGIGNLYGELDSQSLSAGGNSAASSSGAFSSSSVSGINGISTSQGVPHETYGPPKFRV
ncbi:hypothetical protein NE865_14158 [Phthorimaea operculella]|nr:hypothetical protein NE865_14158 [Phthorimaea operculella]